MPQDTISIIGREVPPVLQPTSRNKNILKPIPRNKNPESKPIEPDRANKFLLTAKEEQKRNTLDNNIVRATKSQAFKGSKVDMFA